MNRPTETPRVEPSAQPTSSRRPREQQATTGLASDMVAAALAALPLLDSAARLALSDSRLRLVTEALARYLTHYLPHRFPPPARALRRVSSPSPSDSLLTACIEEALKAFTSSCGEPKSYLAGLFRHVHLVACWHVYSDRGKECDFWDFTRGGLLDWVLSTSRAQFVAHRVQFIEPAIPRQAVVYAVASRAFDPECFDAIGSDLSTLLEPSRT